MAQGDVFAQMAAHKQKALLLLTQQIIDPNAPKLTLIQIAEQAGISERQLFRYRTQDAEFAAARKELVESYADELVSDAFMALKYQAKNNKNVKAAEIILKSRGMLVERREVAGEMKHEIGSVSEKDNGQLMDELAALRKKLEE